jgi:hypothetical protein
MTNSRRTTPPYLVCLLALFGALASSGCGGESVAAGAACDGCASDELCVQRYDGTCTPMSASCQKVSASCRQVVETDPQACAKSENQACQLEICGARDSSGNLFMCGAPSCGSKEVAGTDIGCYGP